MTTTRIAGLGWNRGASVLSVNSLSRPERDTCVTGKPAKARLPYNSTRLGIHGELFSAGI
jgi:hypothetical protein